MGDDRRSTHRTDRPRGPAVLIVADGEQVRRRVARQLEHLGRAVRMAAAPLDALRWLEDPSQDIGAIVVPQSMGHPGPLALLEFFADEYPEHRRILLLEGPAGPAAGPPPWAATGVASEDNGHLGELLA